jgi:hypothetical protein
MKQDHPWQACYSAVASEFHFFRGARRFILLFSRELEGRWVDNINYYYLFTAIKLYQRFVQSFVPSHVSTVATFA